MIETEKELNQVSQNDPHCLEPVMVYNDSPFISTCCKAGVTHQADFTTAPHQLVERA